MDNKTLWNSVLGEVDSNLSKANFNTWFRDTNILKQEEGMITVSVPNTFVKEWLSQKYNSLILKFLRSFNPSIHSIEYAVTKADQKKKEVEINIKPLSQTTGELPLQDYYIDKEDNLNPRYTFDSFVVGPFNELAHAAAQAVIKKPGIVYNPLFIYGNTGHGKTHLIQAIGNYLKQGGKKIYYATSEKFGGDYINAIQNNKIPQFKERYRKCDVLVMDDIQFFANKEKSQEELFHLFNFLYDNNKQIIFSSDKHPNFIPNLEDRLKSRFAMGMIIDIPTPDHESRIQILKNKASHGGYNPPVEVLEFLAHSISGNIRDLEGILNSIIFQTQIKGRELSLSEIKNFIKNNTKPKKSISAKEVVKIIADFYNIKEESIYEKTRKKEVIKPRQLSMYILREDFNISYPSIGEKLGGRDHTTVIHSCEKIKNDLKVDANLEEELNQIRSIIV